MEQINTVAIRLAGLLTGLVLWLGPHFAAQADDDYLSILEAEAANTGTVNGPAEYSKTTGGTTINLRNTKAGKVIEEGLSFEDFEEILSSRYSGSNSLYVKLSEQERMNVYRLYQSDNRISVVREEIVRLLSSG
jgi:hypothetical protein